MPMLPNLLASPWLVYLKVAAAVATIAVAGYTAWNVRGAYAEKEKTAAVKEAVAQAEKDLQAERKLRADYETLTTERVENLLQSISKLQADFRQVSGSFAKERKSNPAFYEQPIPSKGEEQWKKAKDLLNQSAPSVTLQ